MDRQELNDKITAVSKTIFSYCMARTPNRETAEDLSQEIICELIRSADNIRDERAFYGFMWSLAGNIYSQWYRKKLGTTESELSDNIPAQEDDFTECGEEAERRERDLYLLRRELSLLSAKYRRATVMYYIEEKSCREISENLNVSESMVKYLLFKARKILKEGMCMERRLGELSYNPKKLIPHYSGRGTNYFDEFMRGKIRQNILSACYNDLLSQEEISLETGIPLPYLDDEIEAMCEKKILVKEGKRYKANIIVISEECAGEMSRAADKYYDMIADRIGGFIDRKISEYKAVGFDGADFSGNTLRWQLAVLVWRYMTWYDTSDGEACEMPITGWGDAAYIWCEEKEPDFGNVFWYCGLSGRLGDNILFFDYRPKLKGDHHDLFGNERYVDILCDIARGDDCDFSEYDLEAVADLVRMGYVVKKDGSLAAAMPVYTAEQYKAVNAMAKEFVESELDSVIRELDASAGRILREHTPKHLQNQVRGIAKTDKFVHAVSCPALRMVEKGYLSTAWKADEMPTTFVILAE